MLVRDAVPVPDTLFAGWHPDDDGDAVLERDAVGVADSLGGAVAVHVERDRSTVPAVVEPARCRWRPPIRSHGEPRVGPADLDHPDVRRDDPRVHWDQRDARERVWHLLVAAAVQIPLDAVLEGRLCTGRDEAPLSVAEEAARVPDRALRQLRGFGLPGGTERGPRPETELVALSGARSRPTAAAGRYSVRGLAGDVGHQRPVHDCLRSLCVRRIPPVRGDDGGVRLGVRERGTGREVGRDLRSDARQRPADRVTEPRPALTCTGVLGDTAGVLHRGEYWTPGRERDPVAAGPLVDLSSHGVGGLAVRHCEQVQVACGKRCGAVRSYCSRTVGVELARDEVRRGSSHLERELTRRPVAPHGRGSPVAGVRARVHRRVGLGERVAVVREGLVRPVAAPGGRVGTRFEFVVEPVEVGDPGGGPEPGRDTPIRVGRRDEFRERGRRDCHSLRWGHRVSSVVQTRGDGGLSQGPGRYRR